MKFYLDEVLFATKGKIIGKRENALFNGISTDSRKIKNGSLFIPLKGKNFDGHDYIVEALNKGALGAISEKKLNSVSDGKLLIVVPKNRDRYIYPTLKALHSLAKLYRNRFKVKIVAVTGSSGKTTTKDMIFSILSAFAPAFKTQENLNNEIGVPKTLLNIKEKHKFGVIEVGMQNKNEITPLSKIISPEIAIITNIGEAHLKQLKTKLNIAKAKSEIFDGLKQKGTAILNADDRYFKFLKNKAEKKAKILTIGINNKADLTAKNIIDSGKDLKFQVKIGNKNEQFYLPLPGKHNVYNALFAIATAKSLNIPIRFAKKGLSNFKPSKNRMNIKIVNGIRLINDSYNANPSSMSAALKMLSLQKGRRIAIIGDMLELGNKSIFYHKEISKLLNKLKIDFLIAVGKHAKYYASFLDKSKFKHFLDNKKASEFAVKLLKKRDAVLIKASRGIKSEEIFLKIIDKLKISHYHK